MIFPFAVPAQGDDIMRIPGTTRIKYLEENIAALSERCAVQARKATDG